MRLLNSVHISVFVKSGEDEESIKKALLGLLPLDIENEKLSVSRTVAEGFENKIVILELFIEKERHTKALLNFLLAKLSSRQKEMLARQENRCDDNCFFYLRLDKAKLINGTYDITDCGECFHIKMSIAAFPKKKELALGIVKALFSKG